jgi:hypothetical protein
MGKQQLTRILVIIQEFRHILKIYTLPVSRSLQAKQFQWKWWGGGVEHAIFSQVLVSFPFIPSQVRASLPLHTSSIILLGNISNFTYCSFHSLFVKTL